MALATNHMNQNGGGNGGYGMGGSGGSGMSHKARLAGGSDYERRTAVNGMAYGQDYAGVHAGLPVEHRRGCTSCGGCARGMCGSGRPAGMCATVIPDDPADRAPDGPAFNAWPCSTRANYLDTKDPRGDPHMRHESALKTQHTLAHAGHPAWTNRRHGDTTHPGHIDDQFACGMGCL